MESFIENELHATEICGICTEHFSKDHQPVVLPCKHIFGHQCIEEWLRKGKGNTSSCPFCRSLIFHDANAAEPFDETAIWNALCSESTERLHEFLGVIWSGLRGLWQRKRDGRFSVRNLLDDAIIPGLLQTARPGPNPFTDCYNLLATSWDALGRPNTAQGLAIPLVRLARLMTQASSVIPRWLTTVERINMLFWKANKCLGLTEERVKWDAVMEAATFRNERCFPLLHLYTVMISQDIMQQSKHAEMPKRPHEVMNHVVARCCTRIAGSGGIGRNSAVGDQTDSSAWAGKPSNEFKNALVGVYEDLRRHHFENERPSLKGHNYEGNVVRGLWSVASWDGKRNGIR